MIPSRFPFQALPAILAVALAGVLGEADVRAAEVGYGSSFQAASGSYGLSERSSAALVEPFVSLAGARWRLGLSLPVVYRSSPFVAYSSNMALPMDGNQWQAFSSGSHGHNHYGSGYVPPTSSVQFQKTGIGDPLLRADVKPSVEAWPQSVAAFVSVKPPVASSAEGFSTGRWDAGAGLTLVHSLGRGDVFAELGYWRLGDSPSLELHDPIVGSIEVRWPLSWRSMSLAAAAAGTSTTVPGRGAPVELGVALVHSGLQGTTSVALRAGATAAAPDFRLLFTWSSAASFETGGGRPAKAVR